LKKNQEDQRNEWSGGSVTIATAAIAAPAAATAAATATVAAAAATTTVAAPASTTTSILYLNLLQAFTMVSLGSPPPP